MKRLRNIGGATFILVVLVFLFAQNHEKLPGAYRIRIPYVNHWDNGLDSTVPEPQRIDSNKGWSLDSSPTLYQESPHQEFSQEQPSLQDTPPSEVVPQASDIHPDLPLEEPQLPVETNTPVWQAEYPFQNDLDLDLPIEAFREFSIYRPHNYNNNDPPTYAYATFMATRNPSIKDPYYLAIHSLIYRILWSPKSRSKRYPFIVFVAEFVTQEQRQLLAGAGAIVRELAPLEWDPAVPGVQHRWKDLFAKLNMWNETEFSRIAFLDADAFPIENIDSMFDLASIQQCNHAKLSPDDYLLDGSDVCEPYVFAGVPQSPFNETDVNINVGSMVFSPSTRMHQRLLQNYVRTDRYNCLMAEQAFLNWQFNINGAYPSTSLERAWGAFFPQENEEGRVKVVHEKLWSHDMRWLKEEWINGWREMQMFYDSLEFKESREENGFISA